MIVGELHQRRGEIEAALHTARISADPPIRILGQVDDLKQMGDAIFDLTARHVVEPRLQTQQLAPSLEDVQSGLLQRNANRPSNLSILCEDIESCDPRLASGRTQQRGQHPHGRGLAAPVLSQKPKNLPRTHTQINPIDSLDLAKMLDQPMPLNRKSRIAIMLRRRRNDLIQQSFGNSR